MRNPGREYECALCHAVLVVPADSTPKVMIKGASGKPSLRILYVDRKEIHRCKPGTSDYRP